MLAGARTTSPGRSASHALALGEVLPPKDSAACGGHLRPAGGALHQQTGFLSGGTRSRVIPPGSQDLLPVFFLEMRFLGLGLGVQVVTTPA